MTKDIFRYILAVSNSSFQALQEWENVNEDYLSWLSRHCFYSARINRAFFKCYKNSVKTWGRLADRKIYQQDLIDLLIDILQNHYKKRNKFFKNNEKQAKKLFIRQSLIQGYLFLLKNLVKSAVSLSESYSFSNPHDKKSFVIARNFPSHSFSLSVSQNKLICSFGDYLKKTVEPKQKFSLISLDEYTRPSALCEQQKKSPSNNLKPKSYDREKLRKKKSVRSLIIGVCQLSALLLKDSMRSKWNFTLFYLTVHRYCSARPFSILDQKIKNSKSSVYKNYVLGFSSAVKYPIHTTPKPVEFLYARNVYNPPEMKYDLNKSTNSCGKKNRLDFLTINVLRISRAAAGFSDLLHEINKTKKALNRKYKISLPIQSIHCEPHMPVSLGFEREDKQPKSSTKNNIIAIFDTPPDTRENQMERTIFGDLTHDLFIVVKFLNDLVEICSEFSFDIWHKPKYSLENYSPEYQLIIKKLKAQYKKSYKLVSPYSSPASIFKNCSASFSYVGSSIQEMCKQKNNNSYTYVPICIDIIARKNRQYIISGKQELRKKLNEIKKNQYAKCRR